MKRIQSAIPSFKVVYIVRDPVPRAISRWRELRDGGHEVIPSDINVALISEGLILDSSRYYRQFVRFERVVGPANAKVMLYEDLKDDPARFYREICEFLGIQEFVPSREIFVNRSVGQRSDRRLLEWLRLAKVDEPLRRASPEPLRALARRLLKKPIGEAEILPSTRRAFLEEVGEDCRKILDHMGRDHSTWNLSF